MFSVLESLLAWTLTYTFSSDFPEYMLSLASFGLRQMAIAHQQEIQDVK